MSGGTNPTSSDSALPDYFVKYLNDLSSEGRKHSAQHETETFLRMLSDVAAESDAEVKHFMQETLRHYCDEVSMLISYIYETYWYDWIEQHRKLLSELPSIELLMALENIMAKQSDSYAYTKTLSSARYPLTIPGHYSGSKSVRNIDKQVSPANFSRSYYKFGSHKFHVVSGILKLLEFLETRYDLSFEKLERGNKAK